MIPAAPAAVNPFVEIRPVAGLAPGELFVLGDVLDDLAEYFVVFDGLSERKARALAHKALRVDPAQYRAAFDALRRARRAGDQAAARWRNKVEAFAAAYRPHLSIPPSGGAALA